jgi:ABC-type antimicrobial peptide transport system permease subunit
MFPASLGQYFGAFPVTFDTLALGLLVSAGVGVLAAGFPAWQAARVSIAGALRRVG